MRSMVKVLYDSALFECATKYLHLCDCKDFLRANEARAKIRALDNAPFFKKGKFVFVELDKKIDKKKGTITMIRACFLVRRSRVEWIKIERGVKKI